MYGHQYCNFSWLVNDHLIDVRDGLLYGKTCGLAKNRLFRHNKISFQNCVPFTRILYASETMSY